MPEDKDPSAHETDPYTRERGETGPIADRIWRTLSATVRTVGSGEERLRSAVQAALKDESVAALVTNLLPRELVSQLVRTADVLKDDLTAQVGKQVGDFLRHVEVGREVRSMLSGLSLQVKAEIRFVATDEGSLRPKVKSDVDVGVSPEASLDDPAFAATSETAEAPPAPEPEPEPEPEPKTAAPKPRRKPAKTRTTRRKTASSTRKPAGKSTARRKPARKKPAPK